MVKAAEAASVTTMKRLVLKSVVVLTTSDSTARESAKVGNFQSVQVLIKSSIVQLFFSFGTIIVQLYAVTALGDHLTFSNKKCNDVSH